MQYIEQTIPSCLHILCPNDIECIITWCLSECISLELYSFVCVLCKQLRHQKENTINNLQSHSVVSFVLGSQNVCSVWVGVLRGEVRDEEGAEAITIHWLKGWQCWREKNNSQVGLFSLSILLFCKQPYIFFKFLLYWNILIQWLSVWVLSTPWWFGRQSPESTEEHQAIPAAELFLMHFSMRQAHVS